MRSTKSVTTLSVQPETITPFEKLLGLSCVGMFIIVWISSCVSPILLLASILHKKYITAGIIVLITIISHTPWEKGILSNSFMNFLRYYHPRYYNGATVVYEGGSPLSNDEKKKQTFYAIHPHGAFCIGWSILFVSTEMSHVRFCFSPVLYQSPFFRLFSRSAGNPGSAAKPNMMKYMKNGEDLALPPGGFEEATLTSPSVDRVYIKKRAGFIKLCLKYGMSVRPVYAFGEHKLFSNVQGMWKLRFAMNGLGIPALFAWGKLFFPLLPRNHAHMYIAVGAPIELPKIEEPTKEEVSLWHGKYVAALQRLYDDHKERAYGSEEGKTAKLEIW